MSASDLELASIAQGGAGTVPFNQLWGFGPSTPVNVPTLGDAAKAAGSALGINPEPWIIGALGVGLVLLGAFAMIGGSTVEVSAHG